ncbi:yrdC domain-containing protein, mitochondrial-like [Scleropages formosus]|uniref:Threonylcarbamoyl-AMP synthase n=1 Tax=Scleropages formosus TaxID=113540 RepID=A0A0P7UC92_SCLFO|nr:yrdC domain-containing protein, mitochondrial-like [Scleropages formosus]
MLVTVDGLPFAGAAVERVPFVGLMCVTGDDFFHFGEELLVCKYMYRCCSQVSVNVSPSVDSSKVLEITAKALKEGEVVAVPTDTLYGLACLAQNSEAIKKVYDMKGRNGKKPLAICVGEIEDIYRYCKVTVPESLLRDLLPGPVTLVLERSETLNEDLNPFTPLVGVRIPDSGFIRQLSQMCGEPLALTSANVSSHRSTVAVHEFRDLWPRLGLVVDGGQIGDRSPQSRLGSTVIDLSVPGKYRIIRPGCALSSTTDVLKLQYNLLQDAAGH